jgi:predicted RNase H-like nuclease (RuvC/YqgF family)
MTEKQIREVKEQLKERGLRYLMTYRAFEGDIRVIAYFPVNNHETRFTVEFEKDYPKLIEM